MKSNEQEILHTIAMTQHQFIDYPAATGCTIIHREKDPSTSQGHTIILYKNGEKTVNSVLLNTIRNDERHIIRCEDVYVVGSAVLTKDFKFLPASNMRGMIQGDNHILRPSYEDSHIISKFKILYFRRHLRDIIRKSSITEMEEPAFYWKNKNINQYGHYLLEVLPMIWANSVLSMKDMTFLVNKNYDNATYKRDLLKPFYLGNHHCLAVDAVVHCKTLYVSSPLFMIPSTMSECLIDVFTIIRDFYYKHSAKKFRKIYLSRKFIEQRSIRNEDEIEALFNKCGFQIIYLEQFSIEEQINIMINAEYIAAPLGTALHSLLFTAGMRKKIFMITSSVFSATRFFFLQNAFLKYDFSTVFEETNTHPNFSTTGAAHEPYTVNMVHLESAVDDWLNNK